MKAMTTLSPRPSLGTAGNVILPFSFLLLGPTILATTFLILATVPIAFGNENNVDDGAPLPCSICGNDDANNNIIPIAVPDNEIYVPSIGRWTPCSQADFLARTLLKEIDDDCRLLQSFGSLCGCPVRDNPCRLCSGSGRAGSTVGYPFHVIQEDYPYNPMKEDDYNLHCKMLEGFLLSKPANGEECLAGMEYAE